MTTPEEAKEIIRRWNEEGWNQGNYDVAYEVISDHMIAHAAGQGMEMGPDGLIALIKTWKAAFPDGYMTVDDLFAEGDLVVIRNTWHGTHQGDFYGMAPSGKHVDISSIGIDRVADGKVVEGWGIVNMFAVMQQLGATDANSDSQAQTAP